MKKINNPAIAEAFGKTEAGEVLVFETKKIGPRIHDIKELYHDTFVVMPRTTRYYYKRFYELMDERKKAGKPVVENPFALFKAAKPVLKTLGEHGGKKYNEAIMTIQFTWSSRRTLTDTVELALEA